MKNKILTLIFILYILFFAFGSLIARDRDFSDMENRELADMPKLSGKTLASGEFFEDFETYLSDQIICKDFLMKLKVSSNLALGQTKVEDVFFGDGGMLIQEYVNPYNQLGKNIGYINEFADANPEFELTWLIAPNACLIYEDRLPDYAQCYNQNEVMAYIIGTASDKITVADCTRELMDAREEYIYYSTDHHWTMNGAYIGYGVLCEALSVDALSRDMYNVTVASDEFLGTLYSSAPTFSQGKDSIILYENPAGQYKVEYMDTGEVSDTLYNYDNLNKKDKYTTYLDGNHAIMKITSNSANDEKLLVVKDSYAHCLLPLLADNFSEIYVVDLRYYHQSVSELARTEGIERIVFINNLEFLSTDNNFLWLE